MVSKRHIGYSSDNDWMNKICQMFSVLIQLVKKAPQDSKGNAVFLLALSVILSAADIICKVLHLNTLFSLKQRIEYDFYVKLSLPFLPLQP